MPGSPAADGPRHKGRAKNRIGPKEGLGPIERLCADKGLRMTAQRRLIARVLSTSRDHPDVEEVYHRARKIDSHIALSTIYRIVHALCRIGIVEKHNFFASGRARMELAPKKPHDHLIDTRSGNVIEFRSDEIERRLTEIANRLGYRIIEHRLVLYGIPLDGNQSTALPNQ
jgi:Fur family transcriptional regulator, ferric uptake regulator